MKRSRSRRSLAAVAALAAAFGFVVSSGWLSAQDKPAEPKPAGKISAAESEKQKALQNPYSNDLGPGEIDAAVKTYPAKFQEGYTLLKVRCAQCHQPSRPLNSRFVEPYVEEMKDKAKQKAARKAAIEAWRKENPELFKDPAVWQIEDDIWSRYVHRMMNKPGCKIAAPEAKKIWEFLTYDSSRRKVGKSAEAWKAHREALLKQFKEKYPKRYEELGAAKDL